MVWPSRQLFIIGCILLLAGAAVLALATRLRQHVIDAAFWFDPVTYDASEQMVDRHAPVEARRAGARVHGAIAPRLGRD